MELKSFDFLFGRENRPRSYLVRKCWGKKRPSCIRCGNPRIYRLAGERYRCAGCRYTFRDFTRRWIGQLNLGARQWLWILKLFELEVSTRRMAREVGISYPTALKAADLIRCAILHQADDFEHLRKRIALDELCLGGRGQRKRSRQECTKPPVFGILERQGMVRVNALAGVSPENLLGGRVAAVKKGSIVYTDRFRGYDALVFYSPRRFKTEPKSHDSPEKLYIDGADGFWSFAKERLTTRAAVSGKRFPLYLKEMEFRYNHRHENLFELLAGVICNLVPNL